MRRILFVFLDGVGLGPAGPANPFSTHEDEALRRLSGGSAWTQTLPRRTTDYHLVRPLDATLGVEGLPQSGTGQGALFTGTNCAEQVGRHFGPFPHSATYEVLDRANLFHRVQALAPDAEPVAFANAFPPQYFDAPRRRDTVTTHCCRAAGVDLRGRSALRDRRAVVADLTGASWRTHLDLEPPDWTPSEAADVLLATARRHAFTLFEYFLTDKAGHARIDTPPAALLDDLDRVFGALLARLDPETDTLLVTSDHGNLEDLSHTQHTRHPVPLLVHGWAAPHFAQVQDLTDIAPAIVAALRGAPPGQ